MMKRAVLAGMLLAGLAACSPEDGGGASMASGEMREWATSSGKPPSRAEFAAVQAACDFRAQRGQGRGGDACLADYGISRAR